MYGSVLAEQFLFHFPIFRSDPNSQEVPLIPLKKYSAPEIIPKKFVSRFLLRRQLMSHYRRIVIQHLMSLSRVQLHVLLNPCIPLLCPPIKGFWL